MKIRIELDRSEMNIAKRIVRKLDKRVETPEDGIWENKELKCGSIKMVEDINSGNTTLDVFAKPQFVEDVMELFEDMLITAIGAFNSIKSLIESRMPVLREKWDYSQEEKDDSTARRCYESEIERHTEDGNLDEYVPHGFIVTKRYRDISAEDVDERGRLMGPAIIFSTYGTTADYYADCYMSDATSGRTIEAWYFDANGECVKGKKKVIDLLQKASNEYKAQKEKELDREVDEMMRKHGIMSDPVIDHERADFGTCVDLNEEKKPSWFDLGTIDHDAE